MFIGLTAICGGCLALQNDFGTALVFFVTFLVIAYLRSGDFATIGLVCAGCFGAGMVMLTIKPHVAARFASWGHIWEDVYDKGFQQTHTLTAAASGGMIGVGAGKGWLSNLPAADTDIVFGMLCEEWGLVIAVLTICASLRWPCSLSAPAAPDAPAFTHRRMRGHQSAGVPDLSEHIRCGRYSAVHRRYAAVRIQRRFVHAVGMGHARLFEGD